MDDYSVGAVYGLLDSLVLSPLEGLEKLLDPNHKRTIERWYDSLEQDIKEELANDEIVFGYGKIGGNTTGYYPHGRRYFG